jgi:hypothetical protein
LVEVKRVIGSSTRDADFRTFFEFPWTHYKNDPNWVPPLLSQRKHLLDREKNPTWEYLQGDYFVAYRNGEPVGTIAAFVNHRHNQHHNERIGWFGFFETVNDQAVANALLQTAINHVRSLGDYDALRGPANFTLNDECAMLIENFEQPLLLMPYNPPYYRTLVENAGLGFDKVMDLLSYETSPTNLAEFEGGLPEKIVRVVSKTKERNGITTRPFNDKDLRSEIGLMKDLFTGAWERNWGAVPPTDKEAIDLFNSLKDFYASGLGWFVFVRGEPAGFVLSLPDMNQVLKRAYPRPGEPEIITLLKALWHWKIRPKITRQRVLLMGMKPEFRNLGAEAAIYMDFMKKAFTTQYPVLDAGWILETNTPVHNLAVMFKGVPYKRYRFFQAPLK